MASKVTFATLALYVSQLSSEDRNTLCTFLFSFVGKNYTSYNMIELIEVVKELESTLDEEAKKSVLDLYIEVKSVLFSNSIFFFLSKFPYLCFILNLISSFFLSCLEIFKPLS